MSASEAFDHTLPSPIAAVLELRAGARASVVRAEKLTPVQQRSIVSTVLEERILALASADESARPALIVISGSAGGGKSAAINRLAKTAQGVFADVLEDATHAEAPDQEQFERLVEFLAPLADDQPPYTARPLLLALNTGMAIRFFDQLRRHRGDQHGFSALESSLNLQLQLPPRDSEALLPGQVIVVNLDLRPTSGGEDSLFRKMLGALSPTDSDGVMGGADRCATCRVREYCFVRTNAEIVSSEPARDVLDSMTDEIALSRGRPLQPRELWDLAADLVTGGEVFGAGDPCDRIADLSKADKGQARVWERLVINGAFVDPFSQIGQELEKLDSSYRSSRKAHELITGAGIDRRLDGDMLNRFLGAETGREAVQVVAELLRNSTENQLEASLSRAAIGRGLVRAAMISKQLGESNRDDEIFTQALGEYGDPLTSSTQNLEELRGVIADALSVGFGVTSGVETYFHTRAYDARRTHSILVHANLEQESDLLRLIYPDPVREAAGRGGVIVGYRPFAIVFEVAGVPLRVDLPLSRLLNLTARGTKPSSADLERFFHLRLAAEALGRKAVADLDRPLLIADREHQRRYRLAPRRDIRGDSVIGVQEVS